MPRSCAVLKCRSTGLDRDRKFYRFPMLNRSGGMKSLAMSQARQDAWIKALNRADFFPNQFKNASVCDLHFVSGKSADLRDMQNVDWVPTWNLGYTIRPVQPADDECPQSPECFESGADECLKSGGLRSNADEERSKKTDECTYPDVDVASSAYIERTESVTVDLQSNKQSVECRMEEKETQTQHVVKFSTGTQTDSLYTGVAPDIIISLEEKIAYLEEMLNTKNVTLDALRDDDKKTKFFTGLSHFKTLEALYEMFEPHIRESTKLTKFEILFLTLQRLRLNLSFRFLSYQFGTSIPTISKHFRKCLFIMFTKLNNFVYWPDRDSIKKTMPLAFQKQFGDTIVVIIDCFEIFVEKPSNVKAAAQCWSSYKHATTIKYLIGITPQGYISFISNGFGGRASDKFITETCGFLDNVVAGDVVMADRGFLIEQQLKNRCVELQIPAFTKGKSQLHPLEVEETRKIANVRIHVERTIGQIRQKFTILHQYKFPISLIKKKTPSSVSTIDQIVTVCCALSNICSPIVCKEEKD